MAAAQQDHSVAPRESRVEIINTVQKPLGFFVLVVLVGEVILGVLIGISEGFDRTLLIVGLFILFFLLIGIVALMAWLRPESLQGTRPLSPPPSTPTSTDVPEVLRLPNPSVLCASSKDYESKGFDKDVSIIEKFAYKSKVVHNLTTTLLRSLLSEQDFQIVHLLNFVESGDGTLVFAPDDHMSADGFAALLDLCKAQLVVLASCDSIDLAAKVSRRTNIIAATATMKTRDFEQWAECFYRLLFLGHSLSRSFEVARTTTNAPMVLLMKQDFSVS